MGFQDHRHAFTRAKLEYDMDGGNPGDQFAAADIRLTKRIFAKLHEVYPGHMWGVRVSHRQGIAQVTLAAFTSWDFIIKLNELDPGLKIVVKAGGEFLERYRLPRAGFDLSHFLAARAKHRPWLTAKLRPPD